MNTSHEDLLKLGKKGNFKAYEIAIKTAIQKVNNANKIAEPGNYGDAISLLILGAEEYVKGAIHYLQYYGLEIHKAARIHLFFSKHDVKHSFVKAFSVGYKSLSVFIDLIQKLKFNLHNPDKEQEFTPFQQSLLNEDEKAVEGFMNDFPALIDWWANADAFKQDSSYSNANQSRIHDPSLITEEQFVNAKRLVEEFINDMAKTIAMLERQSFVNRKSIVIFAKFIKAYRFLEFITTDAGPNIQPEEFEELKDKWIAKTKAEEIKNVEI